MCDICLEFRSAFLTLCLLFLENTMRSMLLLFTFERDSELGSEGQRTHWGARACVLPASGRGERSKSKRTTTPKL